MAAGDIDNDGDVDLLVSNNGGPPDLLINEGGNRGNALLVRATGTTSNRSGIGARIALTAGGRTQVRDVQSGSSYLSQNDLRVHFGLGDATRAERLEVRWPGGTTDVVRDVDAGQILTVREGDGVVARERFRQESRLR